MEKRTISEGPKPLIDAGMIAKAMVCQTCSETISSSQVEYTVKTWHQREASDFFSAWICGTCGYPNADWVKSMVRHVRGDNRGN